MRTFLKALDELSSYYWSKLPYLEIFAFKNANH